MPSSLFCPRLSLCDPSWNHCWVAVGSRLEEEALCSLDWVTCMAQPPGAAAAG